MKSGVLSFWSGPSIEGIHASLCSSHQAEAPAHLSRGPTPTPQKAQAEGGGGAPHVGLGAHFSRPPCPSQAET